MYYFPDNRLMYGIQTFQISIGKQKKPSKHDPITLWEDHEACWKMQYRGNLGKKLKA